MSRKGLIASVLIAGFMLISCGVSAQADSIPVRTDQNARLLSVDMTHTFDIGIGLGMDYGGLLGFQIGIAPIKHLTFFGSLGYYLIGVGWNVGLKGLFIAKTTKHGIRPYFKATFGSNSVITAEGTDQYDQIYKGFTIGVGCEFRFGKKKQNGFDLDLNVPLRTTEFWDDYNTMKNDPSLEVLQGPMPVAFSIGYHHEF
jgi:hypothetical protein